MGQSTICIYYLTCIYVHTWLDFMHDIMLVKTLSSQTCCLCRSSSRVAQRPINVLEEPEAPARLSQLHIPRSFNGAPQWCVVSFVRCRHITPLHSVLWPISFVALIVAHASLVHQELTLSDWLLLDRYTWYMQGLIQRHKSRGGLHVPAMRTASGGWLPTVELLYPSNIAARCCISSSSPVARPGPASGHKPPPLSPRFAHT